MGNGESIMTQEQIIPENMYHLLLTPEGWKILMSLEQDLLI